MQGMSPPTCDARQVRLMSAEAFGFALNEVFRSCHDAVDAMKTETHRLLDSSTQSLASRPPGQTICMPLERVGTGVSFVTAETFMLHSWDDGRHVACSIHRGGYTTAQDAIWSTHTCARPQGLLAISPSATRASGIFQELVGPQSLSNPWR